MKSLRDLRSDAFVFFLGCVIGMGIAAKLAKAEYQALNQRIEALQAKYKGLWVGQFAPDPEEPKVCMPMADYKKLLKEVKQ